MCRCGNECGLVMSTPIGSHFGCQKLIYVSNMLKFDIRTPSNWMSVINYYIGCVLAIVTHTGIGQALSSMCGCSFIRATPNPQDLFLATKANLSTNPDKNWHMDYK